MPIYRNYLLSELIIKIVIKSLLLNNETYSLDINTSSLSQILGTFIIQAFQLKLTKFI